jgi:hypothetical protein
MISDFMIIASGNQPIGDFYVFLVEGSVAAATRLHPYQPGPPHRDRPLANSETFAEKKHHGCTDTGLYPQYVSTWFALTSATTDNSCLYFVDLLNDSGYFRQGDAMSSTEPIKLQHVSAQPLAAGGLLSFSHRLLHWGSEVNPDCSPQLNDLPRMALTTAFADSRFELPYFDHAKYLPHPPLGLRLGLVCGQQIQYEHLSVLGKHELALVNRIFHKQKEFFNEGYFDKIQSAAQMLMFVKRQRQ